MARGALTMPAPKKKTDTTESKDRGPRQVIVTFKGYPEFDRWLKGYAKFKRVPVSIAIEHSVIAQAIVDGYAEPPPER